MVMGIGEGKIDIILDSTSIPSGGKIRGKLILTANSPIQGRELRVELLGKQWQSHTHRSGGRAHRHNSKEVVYSAKQVLGSAESFSGKEYTFEFDAPAVQKPQPGLLGAIAGIFSPPPIEWYVKGTLDIEMGFDINKEIRISIS